MPALRKRFLLNRTTQACLTESGRVRGELVGDTTGTLSLAAQHFHELPRCTELRTATIPLLESPVAQLLHFDLIPHPQDLIGMRLEL